MSSIQGHTPNITVSLAALDDAQALMRKEWKRGEPGEDIPRQYFTLCGHLTPTQPRHEDMRMESTLNVTPEGSLSAVLAATRGNINLTEAHQALRAPETEVVSTHPSSTMLDWAEENPYTLVKVTSEEISNTQRARQADIPRRAKRMREASQEDVLAPGNGHSQVVPLGLPQEVPITTTGGIPLEISTPAITSTVPTTSTTTPTTGAEARNPRSFLPNGSPSRPTVTATCRQQTWVQRVFEGWTHVPPINGTELGESSLPEPSLLIEEGVPEDLGHEQRVLHPFELPGVRFPTDTSLPNQRRLAENDALVELIQTTDYLEDIPMWGQRDYWLYPPRYGNPFYRGRGRGRRAMMNEWPPMRDSTQGFGRGLTQGSFGRGNGRGFYFQGPLERHERYRQKEEWSDHASEGRRRNDVPICSPTAHSRQPRTTPTPAP